MNGLLECEIGCQEVTVKSKKKKEVTTKNIKKKKSSSKIFKCLLYCIYNGLHGHMLSANAEKTEFEVKLRDKKNKKEWKDIYISLFVALDSVSSRCRDKIKYAEKTKNRFKSNMNKLVNSKYLDYLGERKESKSVVVKKYRILKYLDGVDEIALMWKGSDKKFNECSSESITGNHRTPVQNNFNSRAVSDYSCLSGEYLKVSLGENMSFINTGNVRNHNVGLRENISFVNTGNVGNHNVGLRENISFVNTGNVGNHNVGLEENISFANTENVGNHNVGLEENISFVNTGNVGNHNVGLRENISFVNTGNVGNHNVGLEENISFVNTGNVGNHNVGLEENISFANTENVGNDNVGLGENVSFVNTGNVGNHNVDLGENISFVNTGNVGNHNVGLEENISFVNTGNVGNHNVGLEENISFANTENVGNDNVGLGENISFANTGNVGNHNVNLEENVCFQEMENIEECSLLLNDFTELDEFKTETIFPESLFTNQEIPDFSPLDDNTMFDDIEKNDYNITDPLLSSVMELDESPTYDWHSDSRVFDLDEDILDGKFN